MRNLIFSAYAEADKAGNTAQTDIYLKNACCCLISAKRNNPDDVVALVTNIEIPYRYQRILNAAQVDIFVRPFDCFFNNDGSKWCFAFYKLCALEHMIKENKFEKLLLLDTDVVTIDNYQGLWKEADNYILLHQVVHHYNNANEIIMRQELKEILNLGACIHWGGEFVCGKTEMLNEVITVGRLLFEQMIESGKNTTRGDEFIWTAALPGYRVKSAVAYLDRCWTCKEYYFTSTHMYYPGIVALHLPNEKKRGLLRLFKMIESRKYPTNDQIFKLMRLPRNARSFSFYTILDQIERIYRKLFR